MYTFNMWSDKYQTYHPEDDYKRVLEMRAQCSWPIAYGLVTRLAQRNQAKMLLEVGVAYGYHAHYLLETLPQITYIGVDPYLANYALSDPFAIDVQRLFARQSPSLSILTKSAQFIDKKISQFRGHPSTIVQRGISLLPEAQQTMDRLHDSVSWHLAQFQRARIVRQKSVEAASSFANHSFDLIYIDGDHTYEGLLADINAWWDKVNHQTGIICGDDFSWPEVKKACDVFFQQKGLKYSLLAKPNRADYPIWYFDFSQPMSA